MNQTTTFQDEWVVALKAGCSLVNKACLSGDHTDDLRRGCLTALALLMGASDDWLQALLRQNREDQIKNYVNRRLH